MNDDGKGLANDDDDEEDDEAPVATAAPLLPPLLEEEEEVCSDLIRFNKVSCVLRALGKALLSLAGGLNEGCCCTLGLL